MIRLPHSFRRAFEQLSPPTHTFSSIFEILLASRVHYSAIEGSSKCKSPLSPSLRQQKSLFSTYDKHNQLGQRSIIFETVWLRYLPAGYLPLAWELRKTPLPRTHTHVTPVKSPSETASCKEDICEVIGSMLYSSLRVCFGTNKQQPL